MARLFTLQDYYGDDLVRQRASENERALKLSLASVSSHQIYKFMLRKAFRIINNKTVDKEFVKNSEIGF